MNIKHKLLPTNLTRTDYTVIVLCFVSSICALFYFFNIGSNDTNNKNKEQIAHITSRENYIVKKPRGGISFFNTIEGEAVIAGDQIYSGEKSQARIEFIKSKNQIMIPPKTLIIIENSNNTEMVQVQSGVIDLLIQKGQKLTLKHNEKVVVLETNEAATKIKSSIENGIFNITTTQGEATITSEGKSAKLTVGKVSIIETKKESKKIEIFNNVVLITPIANQQIYLNKGIALSWEEKGRITASLALQNRPKDIVANQSFEQPETWFPAVAPGSYNLRIENIHKMSVTIPLELLRPKGISNVFPENNSKIELAANSKLILRWSGAKDISYEVKTTDSWGKESTTQTAENKLELSHIKGSSYEWSVKEINNKFQAAEAEKFKFYITYKEENKIIEPTSPHHLLGQETPLRFKWTAMPEEEFLFKITDANNPQDDLSMTLKEPQYLLNLKHAGNYTLELTSITYPKNQKTIYAFQVRSYVSKWLGKTLREIKTNDLPFNLNVDFSRVAPTTETIILKLLNNQGIAGQDVTQSTIMGEQVSFKIPQYGKYCFVMSTTTKHKYLLDSKPLCLMLIEAEPFNELPTDKKIVMQFVKMNNRPAYKIELPDIPKATQYEIEIFEDSAATKKILSNKTTKRVIFWNSKRSGIFYMHYRVFDEKQRSSNFSQISQIIFPISPLSDWEEK